MSTRRSRSCDAPSGAEALERLELAVVADHRRLPDLEVDVAGAVVDGRAKFLDQLHEIPFGGRVARTGFVCAIAAATEWRGARVSAEGAAP